ncbi:MAG: hypothetical protein C4570_03630 [Ammonifex sp.]|nr:MAG: hypothetical protein C4570_03630 [Ammonifex sp.]
MRCRPRKLFALAAVGLALFVLCAASAWAGLNNPQATDLHGLKADYAEGKTQLTWAARVSYVLGQRGQVLVWREAGGKKECIVKLSVPDAKETSVVMNYTDANPPRSKEVKYTVEGFGSAGTPSISVTVDTTKEEDSRTTSPQSGEINTPGDNSIFEQKLKNYEEQADWPERLAGSIVMAIPNWIIKTLGLYDPAELIFQEELKKPPPWRTLLPGEDPPPSPADAKVLNTFTEKEFGAVATFYDTLEGYVPIWLVVVLVVVALGIFWSAANPNSKLTFRDYFVGFLLGVFLLKFGVQLLSFVFDINWALVKSFQTIVADKLGESFLACLYNEEARSLGNAILACVAILSIGVINWQYTMRKISIALLLGLLPLVAVVSIPPYNRGALGVWLKELVSNIFLQSAHAAALAFLILLIHAVPSGATAFWTKLAALVGLMGMASLVRRVIGAEGFGSGIATGIGAAFGLGTFFAMSQMLGGRGGKGAPGGAGKSGSASSRGALGTAAGLGLGAVGVATGSMVSGAAGLGPEEGLIAGGTLGYAAGGTVADAGRNVSSFAGDVKKKGFSETVGNLYDPQTASAAGTRIFGDNVVGRTAGALMGAGSRVAGRASPEEAQAARAARVGFGSLQENLEAGRARLTEMRPDLEAARAEHDYAKNMFGPNSANLQEMNARLPELDLKRAVAEQNLAEAAHFVEESPLHLRRAAVDQMVESYQAYHEADYNYNALQSEIAAGEQRYRDSGKNLQAAEAAHAQQRLEVANLEKRLQSDPTFRQLAKLQQPRAPGGLEAKWR